MRLFPAPLLFLILAAPAFAADPSQQSIDRGHFVVYLRDEAVGAETFGVEGRADSINSAARSYRKTRTKNGESMIEKQMVLTASRSDFALRFYQSNETLDGNTMITGVVGAGDEDTALTVYREEKDGPGVASRLSAPPGRWFILDSGMYTLFDLICLNLHGKTFSTRPITLLTLSAAQDTIIEAQVTDLGTETIRWGARPVQARKLQIQDPRTVFQLWASPEGKMLRLVHEPTGLRVEREAPAVKRRAAPAPKPGG
jgi:hypothetical protein